MHRYAFTSALSLALHYVLASLVKGEVLSPEKIRATTGGIVTPSPLPKPHYHTRFSYCNRLCVLVWFCIRAKLRAHTLRHPCLACPSRCTEPLYPHDHCKRTIIHRSHQPFSKPHYPSKIAITLASLVKGEVLSPEKNSGDYRRDCLPLHQPSQNRTIPQKSPPPLPLNERSGSAISQKALSVACYHSLS